MPGGIKLPVKHVLCICRDNGSNNARKSAAERQPKQDYLTTDLCTVTLYMFISLQVFGSIIATVFPTFQFLNLDAESIYISSE